MTGPRVEEAMHRSVRWLDRCITQHESSGKADTQNLFAIVQGGLDPQLRDKCLEEMISRKDRVAGYAIGGLSGGEEKGTKFLWSQSDCNSNSRIQTLQIPSGACRLSSISGPQPNFLIQSSEYHSVRKSFRKIVRASPSFLTI
jgi:hypothetical protein